VKQLTRKVVTDHNYDSTGETFFRVPFFMAAVALWLQEQFGGNSFSAQSLDSAVALGRLLKTFPSCQPDDGEDIILRPIGG